MGSCQFRHFRGMWARYESDFYLILIVFPKDMVHAFRGEITQWNTRLIGWVCLTSITLIHSFFLNWGLRVQNILALVKLGILLFLILSGLSVLFGFIAIPNRPENFSNIWEGTRKDTNAFVSGLYSVIWLFFQIFIHFFSKICWWYFCRCFDGYSNAHYALSETKDPVRTLKRAAPIAMTLVTSIYLLANISYLAVVSKHDILNGGRVIAYGIGLMSSDTTRILKKLRRALFFGNIFGDIAEKVDQFYPNIHRQAYQLLDIFNHNLHLNIWKHISSHFCSE